MSFELINVLTIFQSYIHKVLHKHLKMFMIVFLNDILIYFKNKISYQQHVCMILKALLETKLYIKLVKCQFSVRKIFFIRFVITDQDMKIKEEHINTVIN